MKPSKRRKLFCKRVGFYKTRLGKKYLVRKMLAAIRIQMVCATALAQIQAIRSARFGTITGKSEAIVTTVHGAYTGIKQINEGILKCPC